MTAERLSKRNVMEIINGVPACFEKRSDEICPPKRSKCIEEVFVRTGSNVRFREPSVSWASSRFAGGCEAYPDLRDDFIQIRGPEWRKTSRACQDRHSGRGPCV